MCADFVETIRQTLSADNTVRPLAEKHYDTAKKEQPQATVAGLFAILLDPSLEQPLREQGAVLLRQCLSQVKEEDSVWYRLDEPTKADVRTKLLQILDAEPTSQVRRKVADCVQTLGNALIEIEDEERPTNAQAWPELLPMLWKAICDTSKDAGIRSDCLWAVKEMCASIWQVLTTGSEQTAQVMRMCLADGADAVCGMAAVLLCELIENIQSRDDRKVYAPLIPDFVGVLSRLANCQDPQHLDIVLKALQTTTETADFFKDHVVSLVMPVLCTIAKSHNSEDSRGYALESIVCMVEARPKGFTKTQAVAAQALEVCVACAMELDDDTEDWAAVQETEEDDDEGKLAEQGKESLDRICRAASKVDNFEPVLEVLKPAITKLFQSGEWKQVHAALVVLSQIAEYVDDNTMVAQMVHGIKIQLRANHPRVRYAAWSAIAQFSEDHSELIASEEYVTQIMPEFLLGLDDVCERVSVHCMEAFQHYGESVEREELEPYVEPLMTKLSQKMQQNLSSQKKAITFIAVIAGQVNDAFAPYYEALMPILKQVVARTLHQIEERVLLGKCFECISLLAKAVGRDGFRSDAQAIMEWMIAATKTPNVKGDDPVKEYMMAASERICATMKEDFLPFVPHILPGVLEKLTLAPKEFNADTNGDDLSAGTEVNLTLTKENGKIKVLIMNTSDMEDLQNALECLHTFVEVLGKSFAPMVQETAHALLPVFEFTMAEAIRDLAFETWGQLCSCMRQADQVPIASELVMEFLKRVLPKFDDNDVDIDAMKTRCDGVVACLSKAGPNILNNEQVKHICKVTLQVLDESLERRNVKANATNKVEAAEDEEEGDAEDDDEDEGALRIALCEVAGALMKFHSDIFVAEVLSLYLTVVGKLLQPGGVQEDKKLALFLLCDLVEHLGPRITSERETIMRALLDNVHNEDAAIRQPACYGVSLAAKDPAFAPVAAAAAEKLCKVVTESRGRAKKKSEKPLQACADNALSGIIAILLNHQPAVASLESQLWQVWLSGLPCQQDDEEGIKNHRHLLHLLQQEKAQVVGEDGQNVARILSILIDVTFTDMVDEETSKGIGQLMLTIGEARLEQYAATFKDKQKKKLLRIVRAAQKDASES